MALFVVQLAWYASGAVPIIMLDWDRGHYVDAVGRFLETGTPYLASEVAAPFDYVPLTFLHPPLALWLMTPFAFLPPAAWYIVPILIVAWCVVAWRPSPMAWAVLSLFLLWPRGPAMVVTGNTDMWATAFIAGGVRLGWPAVLVTIKPSLVFFAALGIRARSWWVAAVGLAVVSLPFLLLWLDYPRVMLNSSANAGYSFSNLPFFVLPIVAWMVSTRWAGVGIGPWILRLVGARRD